MPAIEQLICPRCGHEELETKRSECSRCGALLDLRTDPGLSTAELRSRFDGRRLFAGGAFASGVWRYRELVLPAISQHQIVTFPEGNTPLISSHRLGEWLSLKRQHGEARETVWIKHEGMNPTGSFKDRGMTVAITQAVAIGARGVACASTGNTSASLSAYAALAGIPAVVLIPSGKIAGGKLAQTIAHGARVIQVHGNFDDCLRLLREASETLGLYVVNSVNPYRLAGQRTIVYELLHQLDWKAPDWIVLPAGNLGNTSAFGAALMEAKRLGLIDRAPRLAAVQAAGAAPFAQSFADGFKEQLSVEPVTIATAIRIGAPASWDRAVRSIRETEGVVISVTDEQIMDAKRVIDACGIGCEPASAASLAGIRKLIAAGTIQPAERVVAVLTGHLMKDPGAIMDSAAVTAEIAPSVVALEKVLS